MVIVLAMAMVPAACDSSTTATTPTGTPPPGASTITVDLVARDMSFDKDIITAPAGTEVYVNFDNQDDGVLHNFSVYSSPDAQTPLFLGENVRGPARTTYRFPAGNRPGSYYFRCDIHPATMNGILEVTAPGAATTTSQP
jgi:plastocyanin